MEEGMGLSVGRRGCGTGPSMDMVDPGSWHMVMMVEGERWGVL
jgi:hypothetical protein